MPSTANRLFGDLIDIYDKCLPNHAKKFPADLRVSYNELRKSLGKDELPAFVSEDEPVVTYFSADASVNPPKISFPTTDSPGIIFANGTFSNGTWGLPTNSKLNFTYSQDLFQDSFYPVSLQLTATADENTTVSLVVNQIPILNSTYPISQAVGLTAGLYDIFVPAPCFLGGSNSFELVVTSGSLIVTKVEVVSATGTGNVDDTLNALTQTLARLGAENGLIRSTWPNIIKTLRAYSELADFVQQGITLQDQFSVLCANMKKSAMDLRSFCDSYNNTYLVFLQDANTTRQTKLDLIAAAQQQIQNSEINTINTVNALSQYKTALQNFQIALQNTATKTDNALKAKLTSVAGEISNARLELAALQNKFTITATALGGTFFAGAVGMWASLVFLGPIGPFVAVGTAIVAVAAIAVAIGFLTSVGIKINEKQSDLSKLLAEQQGYIAEQKQIQAMLADVTNIAQSLVPIVQYTQGFKDVWVFIRTQLDSMLVEFQNFPNTNNPVLFQIFANSFANQMKPYFNKVNIVLDAYINNFP